MGFAEGQGWGPGTQVGTAPAQLPGLCPQVANHVVQALLNQKVSGFRNILTPTQLLQDRPRVQSGDPALGLQRPAQLSLYRHRVA